MLKCNRCSDILKQYVHLVLTTKKEYILFSVLGEAGEKFYKAE